jgi:hypothetical protein
MGRGGANRPLTRRLFQPFGRDLEGKETNWMKERSVNRARRF